MSHPHHGLDHHQAHAHHGHDHGGRPHPHEAGRADEATARGSLLGASASARVAGAMGAIALIWAGVFWAVS